jgi:16S rRNA (guanine527-N7)-methyltransferase
VHIAHAEGFAAAVASVAEERSDVAEAPWSTGPWLDLGSGGGIPGLVLAHGWPEREAVLLDSNTRRARFLTEAVAELGWQGRVRVVGERAEVAGRRPALRGAFSLVVARSFGPPPVVAECAAPFLRPGGVLVVSEPPGSERHERVDQRWPRSGLDALGLIPLARWQGRFGYQLLRQAEPCPDRFPRRTGVPAKRPIYRVPR